MKILILGAGAVGGYFGALLIEKDVDVTFLVRKKREETIKKNGLNIISPLGDLTVQPKLITQVKGNEGFDLAIISCKAYALDDAMKALEALKGSAYILPLLNGVSHYPKLVNFFGIEWVLGGFAHLSTTLDKNGDILHLNRLQTLTLGALSATQEEFVQKTKKELSAIAPFIVFSDHIRLAVLKKLIFISTAASAACLLNKPLGYISSIPAGKEMLRQSFELNCNAIEFIGLNPENEWKKAMLDVLLDPESPMIPSLLRDMQHRNAIEITIIEDMLQKNKDAGIHNKLLEAGHLVLQLYASKRSLEEH